MDPAFWDSSALVPLCVQQQPSTSAKRLSERYNMIVWWAAPVEIRGAFTRLIRIGQLTSNQYVGAHIRLEGLRSAWLEISPELALRDRAEQLLDRLPLKAADSLQLAAGLVWAAGKPRGRAFLSGDAQLLQAAEALGFLAVRL